LLCNGRPASIVISAKRTWPSPKPIRPWIRARITSGLMGTPQSTAHHTLCARGPPPSPTVALVLVASQRRRRQRDPRANGTARRDFCTGMGNVRGPASILICEAAIKHSPSTVHCSKSLHDHCGQTLCQSPGDSHSFSHRLVRPRGSSVPDEPVRFPRFQRLPSCRR
jgi:hypothetical protein